MSVVSETNTVFDLEEWVLMTERVLGGGASGVSLMSYFLIWVLITQVYFVCANSASFILMAYMHLCIYLILQ